MLTGGNDYELQCTHLQPQGHWPLDDPDDFDGETCTRDCYTQHHNGNPRGENGMGCCDTRPYEKRSLLAMGERGKCHAQYLERENKNARIE